jgi:hypothetical protein
MPTTLTRTEIELLGFIIKDELGVAHTGGMCTDLGKCTMACFLGMDNEYVVPRQQLLIKLDRMLQETSGL